MKIASIDIGTNTVLLLVADVDTNGVIYPLEQEQRLPRLGKDLDRNKIISTSAFDRISWILNEYKNIAKQHKANRIIAAATSAVRDATNKDEFLSYIKSVTGIDVEVLSGDDEALCTYKGVISEFPQLSKSAVVLDIGGGSTEISFPTKPTPPLLLEPVLSITKEEGRVEVSLHRFSLQIGSVRLTERFFKHNPPEPEEVEDAINLINAEFFQLKHSDFTDYCLIGVAGTATTLACLDQNLQDFDIEKVSGYEINQERVTQWSRRLCSMSVSEIRSLSDATQGRADILAMGVLTLEQFMKLFRFQSLTVSERGLRYGLIIREWERTKSPSIPLY
ncbi:MAG: Ppx/GppA family phosphatase [Ignavibacteriae bacterium]|nr:Ppx/GppA family phosphatase [Ignavibacteriota bacterium]